MPAELDPTPGARVAPGTTGAYCVRGRADAFGLGTAWWSRGMPDSGRQRPDSGREPSPRMSAPSTPSCLSQPCASRDSKVATPQRVRLLARCGVRTRWMWPRPKWRPTQGRSEVYTHSTVRSHSSTLSAAVLRLRKDCGGASVVGRCVTKLGQAGAWPLRIDFDTTCSAHAAAARVRLRHSLYVAVLVLPALDAAAWQRRGGVECGTTARPIMGTQPGVAGLHHAQR